MNYSFDGGIESIAVIGMSCRMPEAKNINEFWDNLISGKESVKFFTDEELFRSGVTKELMDDPLYVRAGCFVEGVDMFDYSFFDYAEEEAELIDPQQRIFLECAYEAFEDAGYIGKKLDIDVGVFGATKASSYASVVLSVHARPGTVRSFQAILGNTVDQACLRISYGLNLKGPSMGIQTACSASIVAVHQACESLRNRECSMALAGASGIQVPQKRGYIYDKEMMTSPDGHCRAFDANGEGTVGGHGTGIVLLKLLDDAIKDNDNIYAVIKGSAINNDGASKIGYRAPSVEGQMRVVEEALLLSDIDPGSISYIEGHGTGTFLGDSIEIEALTRAYRKYTDAENYCGLGSVKSNIGHLTQASGIASLIKTVLALKYKKIPPSINFENPNPQLENSPFYVVNNLQEWTGGDKPRRAGLNSFAIGGTNSHIILEEAPESNLLEYDKGTSDSLGILTLSAKSESALQNIIGNYIEFLEGYHFDYINEVAYTANIGRENFCFRLSFVFDSKKNLIEKLNNNSQLNLKEHQNEKGYKDQIFYFSDLNLSINKVETFFYKTQFFYKEALDECFEILESDYGEIQFRKIFNEYNEYEGDFNKSVLIFSLEYATYKMWLSWGVKPSSLKGDGSGELVAACVSGVLSLSDCMYLLIETEAFYKNKDESSFINFEEIFEKVILSHPVTEISLSVKGNILDKKYWINLFKYWLSSSEKKEDYETSKSIIIGPYGKILSQSRKNEKVNSFYGDKNEWYETLSFLGLIYDAGYDVNWSNFYKGFNYRRISLPTYPFERKKCWFSG